MTMCSPTRRQTFSDFLSSTTALVDDSSSGATANKTFFALAIRVPQLAGNVSMSYLFNFYGGLGDYGTRKEKERDKKERKKPFIRYFGTEKTLS